MGLRDCWSGAPRDARLGYAATMCFGLWLAICVVAGPDVIFLIPWCLIYVVLAAFTSALAFQLAFRTGRRHRVLPFVLVSGCLATLWASPWVTTCVDLHLICRVYLAGGPDNVNNWAQELMRQRDREEARTTFVEGER